jgi:UDP-glucose 4-epimerase
MMSVLVTGGAGYIGSHMVWALRDAQETVVVLDDLSTGQHKNLPKEVPLIVGDIADGALVQEICKTHKIDSIVHFAAKIVVPDSVADPLGYYLANTVKSRALMESAVKSGIKHFIFSSTAAVYGNPTKMPVQEDEPLKPLSPYGTSKMMTEMMLRDTEIAHGMKHVILRYFNVAGSDPEGRTGQSTPNATHLIKVALQTALKQRVSMQVFGDDYPTHDGTCIRDFIHVTDLVSAHLCALKYLRSGGSSLTANCGYGQGYSVKQVIEAVERVSGQVVSFDMAPRRPGDVMEMIADNTRVTQTLKWKSAWNNLDKMVEHAIAWEKRLILTGEQ